MLRTLLTTVLAFMVLSCANLYKERAYVANVHESKNLVGECGGSESQNKFSFKTKKGSVQVSTPIHYDYWWTGPIVIPLFPKAKERPDPSFVKITLLAKPKILERDKLMKSEILINGMTETIKPLTVIYTSEAELERYIIQFDHPRLVDLKSFRLKFDEAISNDILAFHLAYDVHYVPILPVITSTCVTD